MPSHADTTIDVRALIDRPGATRSLDRELPVPRDLSDDLVVPGPKVRADVLIERVVDGLLVRGTVTAQARVACARCLVTRDGTLRTDVIELFSSEVGEDDEPGYAIVDATIDLDTMLRDALADAMPMRPLCRPDCRGLCPVCGADLNTQPCDGHEERADPRWATLSELQLPDANQS
ncbi:MAG TPA: DUF177 domain-containing protein [Euzebyales bacterium]